MKAVRDLCKSNPPGTEKKNPSKGKKERNKQNKTTQEV